MCPNYNILCHVCNFYKYFYEKYKDKSVFLNPDEPKQMSAKINNFTNYGREATDNWSHKQILCESCKTIMSIVTNAL